MDVKPTDRGLVKNADFIAGGEAGGRFEFERAIFGGRRGDELTTRLFGSSQNGSFAGTLKRETAVDADGSTEKVGAGRDVNDSGFAAEGVDGFLDAGGRGVGVGRDGDCGRSVSRIGSRN